MANVFTEEQAKQKWCPFSNSQNRATTIWPDKVNCIASACMAWRWRIGMWNTKEGRWWKEGDKASIYEVEERNSDYGSCGLAGAA